MVPKCPPRARVAQDFACYPLVCPKTDLTPLLPFLPPTTPSPGPPRRRLGRDAGLLPTERYYAAITSPTGILRPRVWSTPAHVPSEVSFSFDNFAETLQTLYEVRR